MSGGGGGSQGNDPISNQIHQAVNGYRAQRGKSTLSRHRGLDKLAMAHSTNLMKNSGTYGLHGTKVSHEGFDARVLIARRTLGMESVSENVAAGKAPTSGGGQFMLSLWKSSPGHHQNLLEDWTLTGIGSVRGSDGTVYATQLFATQKVGHTPLRDRINQGY